MDAWHDVVFKQNFLTYDEWNEKYGTDYPDHYTNLAAVVQYYEILGGLLREGLVSIELLENIWQPIHLVCVWERVEPVVKGWRKRYMDDSIYHNIEYLFDRFMERHPAMSFTRSVFHEQTLRLHLGQVSSATQ